MVTILAHSSNYTRKNTQKKGVVMHWIVGSADSAIRTFQNPSRNASAHYVIGGDRVVQMVPDEHIAWHAGVRGKTYNEDFIGIEHEGGWIGKDGKRVKPSDKTQATSARLLASLSQKHKWGRLEVGKNVFRHRDLKPTECSGSLDVEWIVNEANRILESKNNDMDKKHPRGSEAYLIRTQEVSYMFIVGVPGATEYIRSQGWDKDKYTQEFQWYCENMNQEEAYDHWRKVVRDWQASNPKVTDRTSFTEGLAQGKRMMAEKVRKDLAKYLEGLV